MPHGHVTAFFQFDVGDAIDLARVAAQIDASVATADDQAGDALLQYQQPPLTRDSTLFGLSEVEGCRARVKAFDYGVLSIALTHPLPASWEAMLAAGLEWQDNPRLAQAAERLCRDVLTRIGGGVAAAPDVSRRRLCRVHASHRRGERTGRRLLASHGPQIAQLLRRAGDAQRPGARRGVASSHFGLPDRRRHRDVEQCIRLRHAGRRRGVLEILEFANSQLLEFRYYDQLLDAELARTYAGLQSGGWRQTWIGRHTHALRSRCTRCSSTSTS